MIIHGALKRFSSQQLHEVNTPVIIPISQTVLEAQPALSSTAPHLLQQSIISYTALRWGKKQVLPFRGLDCYQAP